MSLDDETIDPRDCTYRLLASSKLRKQIERLIRSKRIDLGLIKPKSDIADFYSKFSNSDNNSTLVNRGKNQKNIKENEIENIDNDIKQFEEDEIKHWKNKIDLVEEILNRSDEDQKQTFTFDDIFKLHQLLQHLDHDNLTGAQSFFYIFQEANFRLMQMPEKRQNKSLDERLRKLKYKAAGDEYDSMVANVAHYIIRGNNKNKTNNRFGPGFGEEFRNLRSTLMATINALMVIGATFLFFYILLGYLRPDYELAKIVLYSFVASMVVAVAEIYFLIRII